MTWKQFTDMVEEFLTVDAERLGAEDFVTRQIRAACLDLQSYIPMYRENQQDTYTASDATAVGACSQFDMPDGGTMRDAYIIRYRSPDDPIDGTTTASTATTITGVGTEFTTALEIGDYISLSSAATTWALVTEIHSDTELKVNSALGDGSSQTINRQVRFEYACDPLDWSRRKELTDRDLNLEQRGYVTVNPGGDLFMVFPSIVSLDSDDYTYEVELNWDGRKTDFEDNDSVPFDEAMAAAVADWVKGECARHLDHDITTWETYLRAPTGSGKVVGTYYIKRQRLFLDAQRRSAAR